MSRLKNTLKITEIFYSLQGESTTIGLPTVFIRLTGCPLRCGYCDTAYAFHGGKRMTMEEILEKVASFNPRHITVTGGEPLAQKECPSLLSLLCDQGYQVSIETSGALDITPIDKRVMIVMDLKTPASKEEEKNRYENIAALKKSDQIKFVLCNHADYIWAVEIIKKYQLEQKAELLFSPSWGELNPTQLADWIVRDNLPVRFQLQLHKILWQDKPGH